MRRTVRLALWTGEEQGLLGSRAYAKQQFGDPETMTLKPAHAKLTGYFNMDNGSGAIRGVYLQGNDAVRPIFRKWLEPFRDPKWFDKDKELNFIWHRKSVIVI